jgi:hypothetical protein
MSCQLLQELKSEGGVIMPTSENEDLKQPVARPEGKCEDLSAALDRALISAERTQGQVQAMRTRLDICLLLELLSLAFTYSAAVGIYSFLQTYEPKVPPEPFPGVVLLLLRLVAMLAPGVIIVVFFFRYVARLKAAYVRDAAYVKKVADVLREAVKPDMFPTRLEWHLFQMRLSRFEIGAEGQTPKGRSDTDASRVRTLGHWSAAWEIPASGDAKGRT